MEIAQIGEPKSGDTILISAPLAAAFEPPPSPRNASPPALKKNSQTAQAIDLFRAVRYTTLRVVRPRNRIRVPSGALLEKGELNMSKKAIILAAIALTVSGLPACNTVPSAGSWGFRDGLYQGGVDQTGTRTADGVDTSATETSAGYASLRFHNGQLDLIAIPGWGFIDESLTTVGQTGSFTTGTEVTNWTLTRFQPLVSSPENGLDLILDFTTSANGADFTSTGSGRVTATFTGDDLTSEAHITITKTWTTYDSVQQVTHTYANNLQHAGTLTWTDVP